MTRWDKNAIILRLDSAKKGEEFWALNKIWKTVRTFYFRKKFYVW